MKAKKIAVMLTLAATLGVSSIAVMAEPMTTQEVQEIMPRARVEDVLVSYDLVWSNGQAYAPWRENETYRRITFVNDYTYTERYEYTTTDSDKRLGFTRCHYVRSYQCN